MKCPHCGMNIRDNVVVCGYCEGKIPQRPERSTDRAGRPDLSGGSTVPKGQKPSKPPADEPEADEEEEGGLSRILHPGEQVLVGSLNVSVKKFFFHAYLTNQRIFLIDTQEKKLKVTAKDIPRDTIAGSISEFSESSDPVLVLSIRSPDDEIRTMKLVFVQNGMDRTSEIDEWLSLIHEEKPSKKPPRRTVEEPEEQKEEQEFVRPQRPAQKQELQPARKPAKVHERQPPVKRIISPFKVPEQVPAAEELPEPPRRAQIRQVPEPVKKPVAAGESDRGIPPVRGSDAESSKKPDVQPAMKVAVKSAVQPQRQPAVQPVKRPVDEPVRRPVMESPAEEERAPSRRPVVHEKAHEKPAHDDAADTPQFCHNCGKKLPHSANFCPGCGTKLGQNRTLPNARFTLPPHERKATHKDTVTPEKKVPPHEEEPDEEETEGEKPQPTRPPVKKAPKGSEMTILHKFLRR